MAAMTHMMVDVETTDTDPECGAILQLAAITYEPVGLKTGKFFDMCPTFLPQRRWSTGTAEFWSKYKSIRDGLIARQQPAEQVFKAFSDFCSDAQYIFVAKPLKFDWAFVESHYLQLGLPMPFHHGAVLDLHSHISGLRGTPFKTNIEDEVNFPEGGAQHNALHDCAYQIDLHFHAIRNHVHAEIVS